MVQERGRTVERSTINCKHYYRELRGGNQSLVSRSSAPPPPAPQRLERLVKLLPYYMECVYEDGKPGASYFLLDEGKKFLIPPLQREWGISEKSRISISLGPETYNFAKTLRQQRGTSTLFYGYPLFVRWVEKSPRGWTGGFAVPVFLQSLEFELKGNTLDCRIASEQIRINGEFLDHIFRTNEEKRSFLRDLGVIDQDIEAPPLDMAQLASKLAATNVVEVKEPILPDSIASTPSISALAAGGLYNRCTVMLGERPKFTAGLEAELKALQACSESIGYPDTALRLLFDSQPMESRRDDPAENESPEIVEVMGLNDEQRMAVKSALQNPLTVVTGPPGTGKSQVVVSILANAYLRREKVLFSSRNHKAISVVEDRINAFSNTPLVIRLGVKSGDRDLRKELIRFVLQVLSLSVTADERRLFKEAETTYNVLLEKRNKLWTRQEKTLVAQYRVAAADRDLEPYRERFGTSVFAKLSGWSGKLPAEGLDLPLSIIKSHASPTSVLTRILLWFRLSRDAQMVLNAIKPCRQNPDMFGELPSTLTGNSDWQGWLEPIEDLDARMKAIRCCQAYRIAFEALKEAPAREGLAREFSDLEERLWDCGASLIAAKSRHLSERLTSASRRALGEFRATLERLAEDEIGGKAYYTLKREMEHLFRSVSDILPLWCIINLSARGAVPFEPGIFDLVIIDEASQCDIPSAIPMLFRAKRAVIIGDPQQLRHVTSMDRH